MVDNWKDLFAPHILARGKKYFKGGNVCRIQHCANAYIAVVAGTEDYEVEISIGEQRIEEMLCSCPYAHEDNCKHMAAVLFALESKSISIEEISPAKQPAIVSHIPMEVSWLEAIDNLPDDIVRKELLKQADRDKRLREQLSVLYLGELPKGQLQNWKADLQEIASEYIDRRGRINDEDTWCFLNDLSNFLDSKLPLLFEVGAVMDTFHLIWIVMETSLEWTIDDYYEQLSDLFQDCKDALRKLLPLTTQSQRNEMLIWYREHRQEDWPGNVAYIDDIFRSLTEFMVKNKVN